MTVDDKLRIKLPQFSEEPTEETRNKKVDEDPVPRQFRIIKKDLINLGYTPHCPGCYSAKNLTSHKPHTPVFRERLRKAMMEDEQYAQRIKDAEGRQDSWLERRVIEGAEATENVSNPIKVDDDMNEPNNDKVTSDLQQADRQRAAHERGFDEDDFHKQVNNDFETRLAEIPDSDDDSMHGLLIGALRAHVPEV